MGNIYGQASTVLDKKIGNIFRSLEIITNSEIIMDSRVNALSWQAYIWGIRQIFYEEFHYTPVHTKTSKVFIC